MHAYIGFGNVKSRSEAVALLQHVPVRPVRKVLVGVPGNSRALMKGRKGQMPSPFPRVEDIANIFTDDARSLNVIQYSTDNPATLADQLKFMAGCGGSHLHGFQLKVCWPDPAEIGRYLTAYPHHRIILRIGPGALSQVCSDPDKLAAKVEEYDGIITDVLLDPTGGHERLFDTKRVVSMLTAILDLDMHIGLGLVGRMDPNAIDRFREVILEVPTLSIQVEDRFDTPPRQLDIDAAQAYYARAHERFREVL